MHRLLLIYPHSSQFAGGGARGSRSEQRASVPGEGTVLALNTESVPPGTVGTPSAATTPSSSASQLNASAPPFQPQLASLAAAPSPSPSLPPPSTVSVSPIAVEQFELDSIIMT